MKRVAIFASGNGSNFEAIVRYFEGKDVEFICVTDKQDSYVRERAKKLGVRDFFVPFKETEKFLSENGFDLIVLAGYMRILPPNVLALARFVNIHPSLLPEFKGLNSIQRAYESKVKTTGVSVHYVNENVDSGEIIAQIPIEIKENMTLEELETGIHQVEHLLFPHVISHILFDTPLKYCHLMEEVK